MSFEKTWRPDSAKFRKLKKTKGIKAIIPCSTLHHLLTAAKRWQAFAKISDGEEAAERSALAAAIPVAEEILKKFNRRNELAFERREERRKNVAEEAMADAVAEATYDPEDGKDNEPKHTLGDVANFNSKRPTRW